jgi:hypothetical protein
LTTAGWIAAATAIPFAASYWWIGFTDRLRFLNPSSRNLVSASLKGYTLGTWQARLSPDTWDSHWRILSHDLVSLTALVTAVLLALLFAGRWRRWIGCCLGLFVAAPVTFPILYAWHEYYFVANAVLLMAAMGLVLCGVLESATPRWIAWIIIVGLYAGQAAQYLDYHYAIQHRTHGGSTELYQTLRAVTEADDVLIIAGEDWNPTTPFYAQRRALMIRRSMENDGSYLREAFGRLKGEKVTALILNGAQRDNRTLQELATQCFDIDPKPAFTWMNVTVYLHRALRVAAVDYIRHQPFIDLGLADKLESESSPIARREMPVSALLPAQQQLFRGMSPQPARFYTTYGLNLDQVNGRWFFNSHPDSRLWFKVPAGLHEISAEYYMFPGAYDGLDRNAATDGVEFAIYEQKADGSKRQIFDRLLNPVDNWDDRLIQKAVLTVEVAPGAELLFETGPGTRGNYNRDWAAWGQITIK